MAYNRGNSAQIIVGAAALFTYESGPLASDTIPDQEHNVSYKDTLTNLEDLNGSFRNVGYTSNGLELQFQPDFGEVQVDQILDVAKLYKQGMKVNLNTTFAEATLENLVFATAANPNNYATGAVGSAFASQDVLDLSSGQLGECPIERGLIAVGPGTGDCAEGSAKERIYVAYRALSIESVTVSAKRDAATMFEVSFRLLPEDATASYGKIVDRTLALGS